MILILADKFDPHADSVEKALVELGAGYFRVNLDVSTLKASKIHFNGNKWRFESSGKIFYSTNIKSVWARRLTVNLDLDQQITNTDINFQLWRAEWNRSLYGMYSFMGSSYWINRIDKSMLIDNKFYQIKLAEECGFICPQYVNSNKKADLISFARQYEFVALKFMSQEMYKNDDGSVSGLYVNKLCHNDLEDFNELEENPITLQRYINKKYEVRYTYVGGEHFACKIDSQLSSRAKVDWRRYDIANTPHKKIEAPSNIMLQVEKIMSKSGLVYGAFDFIVDIEDQWWYLEVNSTGQWLWIEDLAGLPISASIARALLKSNSESTR